MKGAADEQGSRCAGVAASPLVTTLDLPLKRGRFVVDEHLSVSGRPDVFALGDCAAVPDLTRPGQITPPPPSTP